MNQGIVVASANGIVGIEAATEVLRSGGLALDAVIAGVFTVPGDGCVDYPAVLAELPGYAGWAVVEAEQDPDKAHPLTYARTGYQNLRRYLADAGLA